jgi:hypothetical protein
MQARQFHRGCLKKLATPYQQRLTQSIIGSISAEETIMMTSSASEAIPRGLPPRIKAAQAAIHIPEVQAMLRRLSEYDLGICMPHMHDKLTGNFAPLPPGIMQIESGLKVAFEFEGDVAARVEPFLAVGWAWRDGRSVPVAACEMVSGADVGNPDEIKHTM